MRQVKITDEMTDETGETQEQTLVEMYDFSSLPVEALDLNIHIGEASYWSRILQVSTLNNLQTAGVMPIWLSSFLVCRKARLRIRRDLWRLQSVCSSRPACSRHYSREV